MPNIIRATDYRITQVQGDGWHVYRLRRNHWGAFALGRIATGFVSREAAMDWVAHTIAHALTLHRSVA